MFVRLSVSPQQPANQRTCDPERTKIQRRGRGAKRKTPHFPPHAPHATTTATPLLQRNSTTASYTTTRPTANPTHCHPTTAPCSLMDYKFSSWVGKTIAPPCSLPSASPRVRSTAPWRSKQGCVPFRSLRIRCTVHSADSLSRRSKSTVALAPALESHRPYCAPNAYGPQCSAAAPVVSCTSRKPHK